MEGAASTAPVASTSTAAPVAGPFTPAPLPAKAKAGKKKRAKAEEEEDDDEQPLAKSVKGKQSVKVAPLASSSKPASGTSTPAPKEDSGSYAKMMGLGGGALSGMGKIKKDKTVDVKPAVVTSTGLESSGKSAPTELPAASTPATPAGPPPTGPRSAQSSSYLAVLAQPAGPKRKTARELKEETRKRMDKVKKESFDLIRQGVEMHDFDTIYGNQRKMWLDAPPDWMPTASLPREPRPKSLPYPIQFGAGFWLCSYQTAPPSSSVQKPGAK